MGLLGFLLNKWVVLIIGFVIMFIGIMPEYTLKAVRMIGMMGWAEQSMGRGATFSVWKIIGIFAPIIAIIYFFSPGLQIYSNQASTQNANVYDQYDTSDYSDSYYQ